MGGSSFACLDVYLTRDLLKFVDGESLAKVACTCHELYSLIFDRSSYDVDSIVDEILKSIAPGLLLGFLGNKRLRYVSFLRNLMCETDLPKISCGRAHTAAIVNDRLITFGKGGNGELGTGDKVDHISPQTVSIDIAGGTIVAVSCGLSHTCVLTEKGIAYGFGLNKNGQLGIRNEVVLLPEKLELPYEVGVNSVSCGSLYSAVLLDDEIGNIVLFGNGLRSECEVSKHGYMYLKRGEYLSPDEKVVKIAAGFEHMLLLTNIGRLYAVGNGENGRLGVNFATPDSEDEYPSLVKTTPFPVEFNWEESKIIHISAGEKHSALVTSHGEIFTWGCGTSGQLGLGKFSKQVVSPTKLDLPKMLWGKFSIRKGSRRDSLPKVIELKAFAVGVSCASNHTIVTLLNGNVLGFGSNAYGQTGSASKFFQTHVPEVIRQGELHNPASYKVLHAAGGDSHTALLCEDSSLIMCGNESLCGGNTRLYKKPRNRIKSVLPTKLCLESLSCVKRLRQ